MTTYATPADLLAASADHDLVADLATPSSQVRVTGALLAAAAAGTVDADALPAEQDAAAAALSRIGDELAAAGDEIDGYLAGDLQAPARLLTRYCIDLAMAGLLPRDASPTGPYAGTLRRAADARAMLARIARGEVRYGEAGTVAPTPPGRVAYHTAARVCTPDDLAGM